MIQAVLRSARAADIAAIVDIFDRSRAVLLPFLPRLHTLAEDHAFLSGYLTRARITLAIADDAPVGFMAETPGWIEQLYLLPQGAGQGVGGLLLDQAQERQEGLELWCFAQNTRAVRFYERHGFRVADGTAGDNEERLADLRLLWQR